MCNKLISRFCGYTSVCSAGLACTYLCSCIQLVAVLDWIVHHGLTCRPGLPLEWLEQLQCFGSLPHGLSSSRASLSSRIVWTSLNSNWFFKRENRSYSHESSWGLRLELPTHHQNVLPSCYQWESVPELAWSPCGRGLHDDGNTGRQVSLRPFYNDIP